MENCQEGRRFDNIEKDINELKQAAEKSRSDISTLKESQTETKVYLKQIFERLDDIKAMFGTSYNSLSQLVNTQTAGSNEVVKDVNQTWVKVVIELIKTLATIAAIIAGIKLSNL